MRADRSRLRRNQHVQAYAWLRNGNYELTAAARRYSACRSKISSAKFQVEKQDSIVLWHFLQQRRHLRIGRCVARREQPLLDRASIDDEVESLSSDPAVIQEGAALCRSTVRRNPFAIRLESREQSQQRTAEILHPAGKLRICGPIDQPVLLLVSKQVSTAGPVPRNPRRDKRPQASAVDREALDVGTTRPCAANSRSSAVSEK